MTWNWINFSPALMEVYMMLFLLSICSMAWLIGWSLILEYTIGGSAIARGISPNLVLSMLYNYVLICFLSCLLILSFILVTLAPSVRRDIFFRPDILFFFFRITSIPPSRCEQLLNGYLLFLASSGCAFWRH